MQLYEKQTNKQCFPIGDDSGQSYCKGSIYFFTSQNTTLNLILQHQSKQQHIAGMIPKADDSAAGKISLENSLVYVNVV